MPAALGCQPQVDSALAEQRLRTPVAAGAERETPSAPAAPADLVDAGAPEARFASLVDAGAPEVLGMKPKGRKKRGAPLSKAKAAPKKKVRQEPLPAAFQSPWEPPAPGSCPWAPQGEVTGSKSYTIRSETGARIEVHRAYFYLKKFAGARDPNQSPSVCFAKHGGPEGAWAIAANLCGWSRSASSGGG